MKIKKILLMAAISLLTACAPIPPKYELISTSGDQFASRIDGSITSLSGNVIGVGEKGVFAVSQLIPYVEKNHDGSIKDVGFRLKNKRAYSKWLNIKEGGRDCFSCRRRKNYSQS